jgi:hypothetical protein
MSTQTNCSGSWVSSIEKGEEMGKMSCGGQGNVCPGGAKRGWFMATNKVKPKTSGGKTPATKKVSPKKAAPKEAVADWRTAHAKAQPAPKADKTVSPDKDAPFNAETTQVLRDADAGKNLLHYPSLEAMFEDLGI